jgi:hypothetical protein
MLTVLRMTRAAMPATDSGSRLRLADELVPLPSEAAGSSRLRSPSLRAPTTPPTEPATSAVASTAAAVPSPRRGFFAAGTGAPSVSTGPPHGCCPDGKVACVVGELHGSCGAAAGGAGSLPGEDSSSPYGGWPPDGAVSGGASHCCSFGRDHHGLGGGEPAAPGSCGAVSGPCARGSVKRSLRSATGDGGVPPPPTCPRGCEVPVRWR